MSPNAPDQAAANALNVCKTLASIHRSAPVVVRDWRLILSDSSAGLRSGQPVVHLGVQSDGVAIVASLHGAPRLIAQAFVPYPLAGGAPSPALVFGPAWMAELNTGLVRILGKLRASGTVGVRAWP